MTTTNFPIYLLAIKARFDAENPLKSIVTLAVKPFGKCLMIFENRELAQQYITLNELPDGTVPLLFATNSDFLRVLQGAKQRNIQHYVINPSDQNGKAYGAFGDIDSWIQANQQ